MMKTPSRAICELTFEDDDLKLSPIKHSESLKTPRHMTPRNLHSPNAGGPAADLGSPCEFTFSTPPEHAKTPARHSIGDFRSPQLVGEVMNPFRESFFNGLVFTPGVFKEGPASTENSPQDFKWTPEHRAFINPANIDDKEAIRQSRSLHDDIKCPRVQQLARERLAANLIYSPDQPTK